MGRRDQNILTLSSFCLLCNRCGKVWIWKLSLLQETVLQECSNVSIEEPLFIRSHKLHMTVGVMCLMDNDERMLASKLLMEANEKFIK